MKGAMINQREPYRYERESDWASKALGLTQDNQIANEVQNRKMLLDTHVCLSAASIRTREKRPMRKEYKRTGGRSIASVIPTRLRRNPISESLII